MKRTWSVVILSLALALCGCRASMVTTARDLPRAETYQDAKAAAVHALESRLEDMRECVYVYRDYGNSENHFTQRALISGGVHVDLEELQENWTDNPHSGDTCIRCSQNVSGRGWAGWMFLNGYVPEGQTDPVLNDRTSVGAGLDLTGATELRFWARGELGGEKLDFFTMGFNWGVDTGTPLSNAADSSNKIVLRDVSLTTEWKEYVISLDRAGVDLSCIANGFGFSMEDGENARLFSGINPMEKNAVFYLDDIRFVGDIESAHAAPMMLRSYDTKTVETANAAFTYDNALAAMAFLSEGKIEQADELIDALCYAIENDRFESGRIRTAYAAGDISPTPGWSDGAKLPGWYDASAASWFEDSYQVGCNTGNVSYAALALLHYAAQAQSGDATGLDSTRAKRCLTDACQLMDWVLAGCSDGRDGFTAGFEGWPENGPSGITKHTYKSTEHNIDAYAAFAELYQLTGDERYHEASESALRFVESMYDADAQLFYTGTKSDGVTPDEGNVVLDTQAWTALALGDAYKPYEAALGQLDAMRTSDGGYRFHACDDAGYWCEGTAFTALMHLKRGEQELASGALDALEAAQLENGLFPAATMDGLTTGIDLSDGTPWLYGTDAHVAPTAWYIMACNGFNPYVFD